MKNVSLAAMFLLIFTFFYKICLSVFYTARESRIGSGSVGQPRHLNLPALPNLFKLGCGLHRLRLIQMAKRLLAIFRFLIHSRYIPVPVESHPRKPN